MHLLLIGGTHEALQCVKSLQDIFFATEHKLIYSLRGTGIAPQLKCQLRLGGFGQVTGLIKFIHENEISMMIDISHPYAERISQNARSASDSTGVPLWAYRRPAWTNELRSDWILYSDWSELMEIIRPYRTPFFSIGLRPIDHINEIPDNQHWWIRCIKNPNTVLVNSGEHYTILEAKGPFYFQQEVNLFQSGKIDVLVTKNSGGGDVSAKLEAAKNLHIPVCILKRPDLPKADREFENIGVLIQEIMYHCQLA